MALEVIDLYRIDDHRPGSAQVLDRLVEERNDFRIGVFGVHERAQDTESRTLERVRP